MFDEFSREMASKKKLEQELHANKYPFFFLEDIPAIPWLRSEQIDFDSVLYSLVIRNQSLLLPEMDRFSPALGLIQPRRNLRIQRLALSKPLSRACRYDIGD